ncbi:L,D-transpeptidase family protein [Kordiimonas sp. A6E486]|nr:L,D-transpeptidase family protein [Kordiimonas marina]
MFDVPCALGRGAMVPEDRKQEGDGATPMGRYPFRRVFYRPDHEEPPFTKLPCEALSADYGWCDAPEDANYNKLVRLPYGPSHEKMWRDDGLYDLVVVIGHNDAPVIPGKGSAIFMHVARPGYTPTEGCVALAAPDLRRFLRLVSPDDILKIG